MRLQAKYFGTGGDYTKGATYQINVDQAFIGCRIKVYPHRRMTKHQKLGAPIVYSDLSAFLLEWRNIEDKTHEERAAFDELTRELADATGHLSA